MSKHDERQQIELLFDSADFWQSNAQEFTVSFVTICFDANGFGWQVTIGGIVLNERPGPFDALAAAKQDARQYLQQRLMGLY